MLDDLLKNLATSHLSDLYLIAGYPPHLGQHGLLHKLGDSLLTRENLLKLFRPLLTDIQWDNYLHEKNTANIALEKHFGRFRVNLFWQRSHPAGVFRYIPHEIPSLSALSLPKEFEEILNLPNGLILITGPTGSGKSTTLASLIHARASQKTEHIMTFEDPIEYIYKNHQSIVSQLEIGLDTPSFEVGLIEALRQAPHVLVIGEIRDAHVMSKTLHFAQTGHLCLATLHASTTLHAIERILNFYPPHQHTTIRQDLAYELRWLMSQRLLLGIDEKTSVIVAEYLLNTPLIQNYLQAGDLEGISEALQKGDTLGMCSLDQSLLKLCKAGKISRAVALQNAVSENDLRIQLDY